MGSSYRRKEVSIVMAALEGMETKGGRGTVCLGKVWKAVLQTRMFTTGEDERD